MQTITQRIQKAIEAGKVEYLKLTADYKRAHRGLKYKWVQTLETYAISVKQEDLIRRCAELEIALEIIAEFEEAT